MTTIGNPIPIKINQNVNDGQTDFDYLFGLMERLKDVKNSSVEFDFTGCGFLQQNAVVFLGALIRHLRNADNRVWVKSVNSAVRANLSKNGFLSAFKLDNKEKAEPGHSIPYREDVKLNNDDYASYLSDKWLGRGWVGVSEKLKSFIVSSVIEAYINVFDHAESPIGVISCGQHYPQLKQLKLVMADFGIGIPKTVRDYLGQPNMKSDAALRWVFEPGHTTKRLESLTPSGVGLKQLRDFVVTNNGKLEIYSDTGYVCLIRSGDQFIERQARFCGTIVQITVACNEAYYILSDEENVDNHVYF